MWPATGPAPTAGEAALLHDAAAGNRLLQFRDARVGDLGVAEPKRSQASHPFEICQPVTVACECRPVYLGIFFNRLVANLVRPKGFEMNATPVRVANRRFIGAGTIVRIPVDFIESCFAIRQR